MIETTASPAGATGDRSQYDALMRVIERRITTRAFDSSHVVPREHYEMILDAARHAPSGANAQPAAKPPYKRWKKTLGDIINWNRFDPADAMSDAEIDEWIASTRHKVMYRDAENID